MSDVDYRIVRHDGGWGYRQGDSLSETMASREQAVVAAVAAAAEMADQGVVAAVKIEDGDGNWVDVPEEVVDIVLKAREAGLPTSPIN